MASKGKGKLKEKVTKPPSSPLWRFLWTRFCRQLTMWGEKEGLLPHLFFPPLFLVDSRARKRDLSNFFHPTQVRLLLPPTRLLASTTWSSHSPTIPLWQPRSHLGLGLGSMKQFLSSFTKNAYITFSFPLQRSYNGFS
jgi:hypothetical protein